MNERIKELVKKHGVDITIDGMGYGEGNIEGLTELIVRECVDIACDYDAPKMSGPGMIIAGRIETHFGVKL